MTGNFEIDSTESLLAAHGGTACNILRQKFSLVVMEPWPQIVLYYLMLSFLCPLWRVLRLHKRFLWAKGFSSQSEEKMSIMGEEAC